MSIGPMACRTLKPDVLSVLIFCTVVVPCSVYLCPAFATWRYYAGSFFIGYLTSKILAFVFQRTTRFRRPARAYSFVVAMFLSLALLAGMGTSKWYWGYSLFRPPPLEEFHNIARIPVLIPIERTDSGAAPPAFVLRNDSSLAKNLSYAKKNPYDYPSGRLLLTLEKNRLLPAEYSPSISNLPPLWPLAQASGLMAASDTGYESDRFLRGIVVDAVDPTGARLVFLGFNGGQVSNDHYPYYEMLFTAPPGSTNLKFVRGQRLFFDVAGIEGVEWYVMGLGLGLLGMPVVFCSMIIVMAAGRGIARIRRRKRAEVSPPVLPA